MTSVKRLIMTEMKVPIKACVADKVVSSVAMWLKPRPLHVYCMWPSAEYMDQCATCSLSMCCVGVGKIKSRTIEATAHFLLFLNTAFGAI